MSMLERAVVEKIIEEGAREVAGGVAKEGVRRLYQDLREIATSYGPFYLEFTLVINLRDIINVITWRECAENAIQQMGGTKQHSKRRFNISQDGYDTEIIEITQYAHPFIDSEILEKYSIEIIDNELDIREEEIEAEPEISVPYTDKGFIIAQSLTPSRGSIHATYDTLVKISSKINEVLSSIESVIFLRIYSKDVDKINGLTGILEKEGLEISIDSYDNIKKEKFIKIVLNDSRKAEKIDKIIFAGWLYRLKNRWSR